MRLDPLAARKRKARQQLARLPFEEKIAALVHMQRMAKEIAEAAGKPFNGFIWKICLNK